MGVDIYYFYHGFGLQAFEGRHIRIPNIQCNFFLFLSKNHLDSKNFACHSVFVMCKRFSNLMYA